MPYGRRSDRSSRKRALSSGALARRSPEARRNARAPLRLYRYGGYGAHADDEVTSLACVITCGLALSLWARSSTH